MRPNIAVVRYGNELATWQPLSKVRERHDPAVQHPPAEPPLSTSKPSSDGQAPKIAIGPKFENMNLSCMTAIT